MNPQPPPELFAERPVRSEFSRRRGPSYAVRRVITLVVLGIVVGGIAYGLYSYGNKVSGPTIIPTIKAEGNYKQKPQQPGGIDIPHQDVEVYHELDNGESPKSEVEHLLPGPEVPQPVPAAPTTSAAGQTTVPVTQPTAPTANTDSEPESLMPPQPAPTKIETTVTSAPAVSAPAASVAVAPAPVAAPAAAVTPTPAPVVAAPAAVANPAPAAPVITPPAPPVAAPAPVTSSGHTAVQLASIPDEAQAEAAMAKLQSKYAGILGAAKLRLVRADLGAKGIYYRIQSQSLSEQQADRICSALKGQNAGCILVRQ